MANLLSFGIIIVSLPFCKKNLAKMQIIFAFCLTNTTSMHRMNLLKRKITKGAKKMTQYVVDTNALKKMMVDEGIETTIQLAEETGVNRNTAAGIIDGTIRPSTNVIEKFARRFSMTTEQVGAVFFKHELA